VLLKVAKFCSENKFNYVFGC